MEVSYYDIRLHQHRLHQDPDVSSLYAMVAVHVPTARGEALETVVQRRREPWVAEKHEQLWPKDKELVREKGRLQRAIETIMGKFSAAKIDESHDLICWNITPETNVGDFQNVLGHGPTFFRETETSTREIPSSQVIGVPGFDVDTRDIILEVRRGEDPPEKHGRQCTIPGFGPCAEGLCTSFSRLVSSGGLSSSSPKVTVEPSSFSAEELRENTHTKSSRSG